MLILGGDFAEPHCKETFDVWHKCVEKRDLGKIRSKVAQECTFHSPTVGKPFEGADSLCIILSCVSDVFGDTLKYHRQWLSGDGRDWALEFTALVKGIRIKGLDLVTLTADGMISKFEVVIRPLKGVAVLKEEMEKLVLPRIAEHYEKKEAAQSKQKSRL